jgi:hypothetical protein
MGLRERLNAPFPYYLNDDRKNLVMILAISAFVILFLHFYKAHSDLNLTFPQKALFGGVTFVCLTFNIILLPKIFMVTLDSLQWTVKKYVLHNIWHLILIGIGTTFVDLVYICPEKSFWEVVVLANTQVVLKGAIPIALITLFLKNRMLKETLQKAMESNREIERITAMKSEPSRTANTITLQSDTSETATFKLPDLLFIEADDNYSTIIWKNGHGMEKKLLRANLKNIENQLNNPYTIRCHRSYIVNVNAIASISGNANGYKLLIRDTDITIPVSRPKGREVMDKISQLRNMMELST